MTVQQLVMIHAVVLCSGVALKSTIYNIFIVSLMCSFVNN